MTTSREENKENMLSIHLRHLTRKSKPLSPFISKLRFLLSTSKHQDAIHWSTDGRSIVITDIETFKKSVLDNEGDMFKTRNFTSFVRQLNLYGFRKIPNNGKTDPTSNMKFEHVHFRRERPDLMQLVHRTCLTTQKRKLDHTFHQISNSPCNTITVKSTKTTTTATTTDSVKLPNIVFVKQKKDQQYLQLPTDHFNSNSITGLKHKKTTTPLGLSVLHNLKTQTDQKYTTVTIHDISISDHDEDFRHLKDSFNNCYEEKEDGQHQDNKEDMATSDEHNYALPTTSTISTTDKELDEKQIYQFLNETFSLEKEVVQTLLNLSNPYSKEFNVIEKNNFKDLNILADVSETILTCSQIKIYPHLVRH